MSATGLSDDFELDKAKGKADSDDDDDDDDSDDSDEEDNRGKGPPKAKAPAAPPAPLSCRKKPRLCLLSAIYEANFHPLHYLLRMLRLIISIVDCMRGM